MKRRMATLNIPLTGRLYESKTWTGFDLSGLVEWEALRALIRVFPVEMMAEYFDQFRSGLHDVPLFIIATGWKPRSPEAAIIAERPEDYFEYVGGDWAGPRADEIHVAPEVCLTLPDAFLYVAFEFTEDRAIKQNIVNLAENMVDSGWPLTRDLSGMQLPKGFMKLRTEIEAEAMQNGVGGGSPSAVAASI
jgi:hypothetical protein